MNKKSIKRLLAVLIAAVLFVSSVPFMVSADNTVATATQITSFDQLVNGQYVIATTTNVVLRWFDNGWIRSASATFATGSASDPVKYAVEEVESTISLTDVLWTVTVSGSSVTLTDVNGKTVAPKEGNQNGILNAEYNWAVSETDGVFTFAGTGDDVTTLAYNIQNDGFRSYKNTTLTGNSSSGYVPGFYLYKLDGNVPAPEQTTEAVTAAPETDAATTAPDTEEITTAPEVAPDSTETEIISAPVAGTAYKFYIKQAAVQKDLYLNGVVSGRYFSMTTELEEALDFYAEEVEGGYRFYTEIEGAKKYIEVYENESNKISVKYDDTPSCVYTYNAETFAWETTLADTDYYLGTYNTFETTSASKSSFITAENTRISQFPLELVIPGDNVADDETTAPEADVTTTPETDVTTTPEAEGDVTTVVPETDSDKDESNVVAKPADKLNDGSKYVVYYPDSSLVIGSEVGGKNSNQLVGVEATPDKDNNLPLKKGMAVFTVENKGDNVFYLKSNGKYLTAGETGNSLALESKASAYSEWTLEEAENGWYIKNVNAKYNDNAQYLEYYYNFTTYGFNDTKTNIYTFNFYEVPADADLEEEDNPVTGDSVVILIAVVATLSIVTVAFVSKKKYSM